VHAGEPRVVGEDDSTLLQQSGRVDQVEEHALEAMVAVEKREIELPALCEQPREHDLRFVRVELDEVTDTCLFEDLQPDPEVRRPVVWQRSELVRVGGDVPHGPAVRQQPFEHEESREPEAEAGLERQ
jgi:hypothetical protein